jgi:hypothetical protein
LCRSIRRICGSSRPGIESLPRPAHIYDDLVNCIFPNRYTIPPKRKPAKNFYTFFLLAHPIRNKNIYILGGGCALILWNFSQNEKWKLIEFTLKKISCYFLKNDKICWIFLLVKMPRTPWYRLHHYTIA